MSRLQQPAPQPALPEFDRLYLWARERDAFSLSEIAEYLGVAHKTAKEYYYALIVTGEWEAVLIRSDAQDK